jgi:nucleoside-diphosphate-sugar epimerase
MKRIVMITGATGFVGNHLCIELMRAGYVVRAAYTDEHPSRGLPNGVEWVKVDSIGPSTNWTSALSGGVTHIVHLAAVAHKISAKEKVSDDVYERVNHQGTESLARAAAKTSSIQRLFFMSSIGAVTSGSQEPVNEQTLCRPDSPYGKSKLAAESAIQRVLLDSHVEWCIFRTPLLYGPGNPGNMKRLVKLLNRRIPLPLASVHNRRTFFYVGNLVSAVRFALEHPTCSRKVFCVGDIEDLSTPDLLRGLSAASSIPVRLFPFPLWGLRLFAFAGTLFGAISGKSLGFDLATMEKLCGSLPVDSSYFRRISGWTPSVSIEQGLSATVR